MTDLAGEVAVYLVSTERQYATSYSPTRRGYTLSLLIFYIRSYAALHRLKRWRATKRQEKQIHDLQLTSRKMLVE